MKGPCACQEAVGGGKQVFRLDAAMFKEEKDLGSWDWTQLADQADRCRWSGPGGDPTRLP